MHDFFVQIAIAALLQTLDDVQYRALVGLPIMIPVGMASKDMSRSIDKK